MSAAQAIGVNFPRIPLWWPTRNRRFSGGRCVRIGGWRDRA